LSLTCSLVRDDDGDDDDDGDRWSANYHDICFDTWRDN
jgi:hypothetical protein